MGFSPGRLDRSRAGNDYGHPAGRALAMLRSAGATTFSTDRGGQVVLVPSRGSVQVGVLTRMEPAR
jgi:beta-lactamase superfamily II metal-dependent hydrolase